MKHSHDKKDFSSLLREAGYKSTPHRLDVLEALHEKHIPLSIEELESKLSTKGINQSTLYRILDVLVTIGLVKQTDLRQGKAFFEIIDHENHHHHLVCTSCNKTEDVEVCEITKLEQKILASSKGFKTIKDHSLEFFGLCKNCG